MLTTNQKGSIAEQAIALAATRLGIEVYRPIAEGGRFDLIFAFEDASLARVQCKCARKWGDVVQIRPYTSRRAREGLRVRQYTADETMRSPPIALNSTGATTCRSSWWPGDACFICACDRRATTKNAG